ncbi:MAG: hypothetical protein ACKODX_17435 [Gemmata sp.]|jgi:hypothetical protein
MDDEFDPPSFERPIGELRRIARYHRWLVAVVLAQLALWLGFLALAAMSGGRVAGDGGMNFAMGLTLVLGCVGGGYVFLLSYELRGLFAALVFGLATVIPCMGLLILTLVSGYATAELRKHGVKVGLFGASDAAVEERPSLYDDEDAGW